MCPFDTIKTLVQSENPSNGSSNELRIEPKKGYKPTAIQCTYKILLAENAGGVAGRIKTLYRGFGVAILRGVPGAGITLGCYQLVRDAGY